jgi:hypothetical protein
MVQSVNFSDWLGRVFLWRESTEFIDIHRGRDDCRNFDSERYAVYNFSKPVFVLISKIKPH